MIMSNYEKDVNSSYANAPASVNEGAEDHEIADLENPVNYDSQQQVDDSVMANPTE